MHIHILGICGTFMGGLAQLAKALGHRVTGCDTNVYPPMSTQLELAGIELTEGWGLEQLDLKPDLFVVGNVVSRGNPLMEAILNARLPYTSGPQWIGEHVLAGKKVIAVAGTHGKTTTASMLAWTLKECGIDPGYLIGGVPLGAGKSAHLSDSEWFVIEADEYDTAFFDKRSKFVHYRPAIAILNNLEFDHADIFPNLAAIQTQFHHLVRTVPSNGVVVTPVDCEAIDEVIDRGLWSQQLSFGRGDNASLQAYGGESEFSVSLRASDGNSSTARVSWQCIGEHNVNNGLAVLAALTKGVGLDLTAACAALSTFPGVKRRMELRGELNGIRVYDDFAHHPTAIETTLTGAKHQMPEAGRLIAVLEPRSNTMKLGTMKQVLPKALDIADVVWCFDGGVDWDVAEALKPLGSKVSVSGNLEALVGELAKDSLPGDWIVVMSNGGFGGIHTKLLDALETKYASS